MNITARSRSLKEWSSLRGSNINMPVQVLLIFLSSSFNAIASDIFEPFEFTEAEISSLESYSLLGKTEYSILSPNDRRCNLHEIDLGTGDLQVGDLGRFQKSCLKAEANAGASGLGKKIKINLLETPFLNISWKVEKSTKGFDESTKAGHDFPARVNVIKKTGVLPWQRQAISYVFSNSSEIGENWPSPHSERSYTYIASSLMHSSEGEWVSIKVNVKEHYKELFNVDYDQIDGIAVMTDSDNTEGHAIAYYGRIYFSSS